MAIIHKGKGLSYRWTLKDTSNDGSRVTVKIDVWGMSRDFPTVLQSDEAAAAAEDIAPRLLAMINSER